MSKKGVTLRVGDVEKPGPGRKAVYPFDRLAPGLYLEFDGNHPASARNKYNISRVVSPARSYAKRHGWKISIKHNHDTGETRVYRIA